MTSDSHVSVPVLYIEGLEGGHMAQLARPSLEIDVAPALHQSDGDRCPATARDLVTFSAD